jgi:hypothetical protein
MLTARLLGVRCNSQKYSIIRKMLEFRTLPLTVRVPSSNNVQEWRRPCRELFLDLETLFDEDDEPFLFLIGARWDGKCYSFLAEAVNKQSEEKIWKDFANWAQDIGAERIVHWGNIENAFLQKMSSKYGVRVEIPLLDLLEVFRDDEHPILIKNVYDFSMKSVARRLHENGLISEGYSGKVSDGSVAMVMAQEAYRYGTLDGLDTVVSYNKQDCRILEQILRFIREF